MRAARTALLLVLVAAPAVARAAAVVDLRPHAEVAGVVFRLGDLGAISGEDETEIARLRQVVLARTPGPGREVRLTRGDLRGLLLARRAGDVRLEGATAIVVRARVERFDAESIEAEARRFLEARLADLPGREIVSPETEVRAMVVPAGREETRLEAVDADVPRTNGLVRITVRAIADGVPLDTRVLSFLVRARAEVLVLARDVRPGELVTPGLVETRVVEVTDAPTDLLLRIEDLRRAKARQAIPAGTPIREAWLQRLPDVRRGDLVELVYRRGSVEVRVRGIADTEGAQGAVVFVVNSSSGRRVPGRVVGPGLVEAGEVAGGER